MDKIISSYIRSTVLPYVFTALASSSDARIGNRKNDPWLLVNGDNDRKRIDKIAVDWWYTRSKWHASETETVEKSATGKKARNVHLTWVHVYATHWTKDSTSPF